ncbi:SEC-C motif-containing protein [Caldanaerobius fijiensis DSM 17918]|uniref:SEC-C motif-containing protein n=1 Tax=Caldanaerobius fijiensis DSM 17918 TaxID=1121256 RepID=A0A1M5BQS0_9THEO|nr:SEC-C domain-containing protein [Caldanaerobius fijiensis]SHF44775.1 SEC-C motif-containing protein [Caldanaerobius fijiensis DSM 17918]
MDKIFDIDRNGECICGSGKKYKKCCFPLIDKIDTTLLKTIEKEETITSYGREFIHIVSVLYGVKLEEESQNSPDLEELAKIILEVWDERDKIFDEEKGRFAVKATVEELIDRIGKIVEKKETLKHFRVPVDFLVNTDLQTEEEVVRLLEKLSESLLLEDYLLDLAYSLRNEEYSREEIKTVFVWILLAAKNNGMKDFMIPVLKVTIDELNTAKAKFKEIIDKASDKKEDDEQRFLEMLEIYQEYPIFEEYMARKLLMEFEDDLEKILACVDFNIPFYAIYAFYLRLFTNIADVLYNKRRRFESDPIQ